MRISFYDTYVQIDCEGPASMKSLFQFAERYREEARLRYPNDWKFIMGNSDELEPIFFMDNDIQVNELRWGFRYEMTSTRSSLIFSGLR
jgi:hypothetical protein